MQPPWALSHTPRQETTVTQPPPEPLTLSPTPTQPSPPPLNHPISPDPTTTPNTSFRANDRGQPRAPLTAQDDPGQILTQLCPWASALPKRLRDRLVWDLDTPCWFPEDSDVILIFYAGADDEKSLKKAMFTLSKSWPVEVIEIDNKREGMGEYHNMLLPNPYSSICRAALRSRLKAILGGPNCRTWSILRWFPKPGAPLPVRGRTGPDVTLTLCHGPRGHGQR